MSKAVIVYWSDTGNTKMMAEAIKDGMTAAGSSTDLVEVSTIEPAKALEYDHIALGCPSMGAEVLEEAEFQPFYDELSKSISGKKIALFGSYGWGDGEWMRVWQDEVNDAGASLYNGEGLMVNYTPDDEGLTQCKSFGEGFAKY